MPPWIVVGIALALSQEPEAKKPDEAPKPAEPKKPVAVRMIDLEAGPAAPDGPASNQSPADPCYEAPEIADTFAAFPWHHTVSAVEIGGAAVWLTAGEVFDKHTMVQRQSLKTGKVTHQFGFPIPVRMLGVSPTGNLGLIAGRGTHAATLEVWSCALKTARRIAGYELRGERVRDARWIDEARCLLTTTTLVAQLNVETGRIAWFRKLPSGAAVALSPGGRQFAVVEERSPKLYDAETGALLREFVPATLKTTWTEHHRRVGRHGQDDDDDWFANSAHDSLARKTPEGVPILAFRPDGAKLAAALRDAVAAWDVPTGTVRS